MKNIQSSYSYFILGAGNLMRAELFDELVLSYCIYVFFFNICAQDSNAVVEISLKLAHIFMVQNHVDKAKQGFEFCTKTQQLKVEAEGKTMTDNSYLLAI